MSDSWYTRYTYVIERETTRVGDPSRFRRRRRVRIGFADRQSFQTWSADRRSKETCSKQRGREERVHSKLMRKKTRRTKLRQVRKGEKEGGARDEARGLRHGKSIGQG